MKITYQTTLDLELNNFTKSIDKPVALLHIKDGNLFQNCSTSNLMCIYIIIRTKIITIKLFERHTNAKTTTTMDF